MQEKELFKMLVEDDMVNFNAILMKYYSDLSLTEKDIFVLSSLTRQLTKKNNLFNLDKLKARTSIPEVDFFESLENLTNKKYLDIRKDINPKTGKESEYFYLDGLYDRIVYLYLDMIKKESDKMPSTFEEKVSLLYEKTFNKQMTIRDAEIISRWASTNQFSFDEIKDAILDAAKVGKYSLNYVDSKLLKKRVKEENNPEYETTNKIIKELSDKWKK